MPALFIRQSRVSAGQGDGKHRGLLSSSRPDGRLISGQILPFRLAIKLNRRLRIIGRWESIQTTSSAGGCDDRIPGKTSMIRRYAKNYAHCRALLFSRRGRFWHCCRFEAQSFGRPCDCLRTRGGALETVMGHVAITSRQPRSFERSLFLRSHSRIAGGGDPVLRIGGDTVFPVIYSVERWSAFDTARFKAENGRIHPSAGGRTSDLGHATTGQAGGGLAVLESFTFNQL